MANDFRNRAVRPRVAAARALREGLIAGLLGGLATALAYLFFDWATGQPMRSAEVVTALASNAVAVDGWSAQEVVGVLIAHLAFWILVAVVAACLMSYADLHPRAWSVIFGGIAVMLLSGLHVAGELSRSKYGGVPLWAGTLLGAGVMGRVLMRRHTGFLAHLEEVSLTPTAEHDLEVSYGSECRSLARYRAAAACFPDDPTIAELLRVSENRVAQVEALFANYHRELPEASLADEAMAPVTPIETWRESIRDEEQKVTMYTRFLLSVDEERARSTFSHLHWHASDLVLPILRERVSDGGPAT